MRVVGIDTTSSYGSMALREDGELLEELQFHSPDGFSRILFDGVRSLLERHEWPITSIGCFAAASGPGSFTGVRIGLTAVKGLAEATGAAAIAVSNLQALAAFGTAARRGVIIDARRGEIYAAVYDSDLRCISPKVVMRAPEWLNCIGRTPEEFISTDASTFRTVLPAHVPVREQRIIAGAVAAIAESNLRTGASGDPILLDANYVRKSDAELFWRDP